MATERNGKSIKQQLDDLFNEWVKRNTAEVGARVESLGGIESLTLLKGQMEPFDQLASLLDFHPQFKAEYAERGRQHLVSIGVLARTQAAAK